MPETEIFHLFPNLPPEIRNQIWRFATHLFTLVMDATLIPYSHIEGGAWIIRATHSSSPIRKFGVSFHRERFVLSDI
jgi:hypothetical protein